MARVPARHVNRIARERYGWTVHRVASLAGCLPSDVIQYEAGARFVDRPALLDFIYTGLRGIAKSDSRRRAPAR